MSQSFAAWVFAGNGGQLNAVASHMFVAVDAVRLGKEAKTVSKTNERAK